MTHADLVQRAYDWLTGTMGCKVAFAEPVTSALFIPDVIGWRKGGAECHVVECKISRADFLRDSKKPHVKAGQIVGTHRWYIVPNGLVRIDEVPDSWGLVFAGSRMSVIRKAEHNGAARSHDAHVTYSMLRRFTLNIPFDQTTGRFRTIAEEKHGND